MYRPYPSRDRALRQLDRHAQPVPPRQPSEFEQRMMQQANAVLTTVGESLRPIMEGLVLLDKRLKEGTARSAPGVLVRHKMAEAMRLRA